MAVSGRKIGTDGGVVPVVPGGLGPPEGGAEAPVGTTGGAAGAAVTGRGGGRMMKHAGPALRWLACEAVGLPVDSARGRDREAETPR